MCPSNTRAEHRGHLTHPWRQGCTRSEGIPGELDPLLSSPFSTHQVPGRREGGQAHPGGPCYLGDVGVADLGHDVADVLKDEEPCVQAPEVELVLHVIVYDLSTPHNVLERDEHVGIKAGQRVDQQSGFPPGHGSHVNSDSNAQETTSS